jgi:hypothetical protein
MSEVTVQVTREATTEEVGAALEKTLGDRLQCTACQEILADDSVLLSCGHRMCASCFPRCDNKCPIHRRVVTSTGRDRLVEALLQMYPRVAECGLIIRGNLQTHQETCRACWRAAAGKKDELLRMREASLARIEAENTRLKRRIAVLEEANREEGRRVVRRRLNVSHPTVTNPMINVESDTEVDSEEEGQEQPF